MNDNIKDQTTIPLFCDAALVEKEKTVITFGCPRGGTSMVAGVLRMLGVFMGNDLPNNHEDQDFVGRGHPHYKKILLERNESHSTWGWKNPNAANYIETLRPLVRNPFLIVVCRDIAANALGHKKYHNRSLVFALDDIVLMNAKNVMLVKRWQVPTLMVSYEKAISNPVEFTKEVVKFLGLQDVEYNQEAIIEFMRPGTYKPISATT